MKKFVLSSLLAIGAFGGLAVSQSAMAVDPNTVGALHNDPTMCSYKRVLF